MSHTLHLGDNLATLKNYPDNTFDSIVTDPPYGIDFLGKDWDSHTGTLDLYKECLRVLKPGGYLLAFSAARTYHKLAYSVELAGFEIRDQLIWLYSSGFPKAQDIGKAIAKREQGRKNFTITDEEVTQLIHDRGDSYHLPDGRKVRKLPNTKGSGAADQYGGAKWKDTYEEVFEHDNEWNGFKTALKPAHEPIVMARKPFKGSTIDNVLKNGLGAMNIDATRVPWADEPEVFAPSNGSDKLRIRDEVNDVGKKKKSDRTTIQHYKNKSNIKSLNPEAQDNASGEFDVVLAHEGGRYPSNVIGEVSEGYQKYFACPKVSRKERHSGFEMPEALTGHIKGCYAEDGTRMAVGLDAAEGSRGNNHPTVKPVALMDYLIKLVTPPSTPTLQRKVLDPFMGSGSTGMAATALGHHFTGCELDPKYVDIAETRIEAWNKPEVDDNALPTDLFGEIE